MKIATMATGGIGGFLAARLGEAGHQVATIARGAHLEAIRQNGLRLEAFDGDVTHRPWIATDDPAEVGPVDAILFGVKAGALDAAAQACRPMIGPETAVVPFLNGVEASDRLAAILPPENVANGVAYISTTVAAPGVIRQTGDFNRFVFAERDSRPSARIDRLRAAIDEAGSTAPPTDDIDRDVWKKFVLFTAVSGITAAARCTMKQVLENEPLAGLFRTVLTETAATGRALGVALEENIADETWQQATGFPEALRASTAIDLEQGRPLETEWINGAVMRLAQKAGLAAPANEALYALLSPYFMGSAD